MSKLKGLKFFWFPNRFAKGVSMGKTSLYLLLLFCTVFYRTEAAALDIMLAQVYEENIDVSGWLVSEKLDGLRGYWNGKMMLSKNGAPFHPPAAFTRNFPDFAIEGEIWGGRGTFEQTAGIVKKKSQNNGWLGLKFAIFDVPGVDGKFEQRLEKAKSWFLENPSEYAFVIAQKTVSSNDELKEELRIIEGLGGEGLIVRRPDALYTKGRSGDILKVKSYLDAEAVVLAHIPGKGKNQGRVGSLFVELPDGKQFRIGTGLSDAQRDAPPAVGSTITFKYYGFYQSGIPKFPSFLRVRQEAQE